MSQRHTSEGYWIPIRWLNQWRESVINNEYPSLDPVICSAITCNHGNLTNDAQLKKLVKTEVWSYFRAMFPDGPEYPKDTPPCKECVKLKKEVLQHRKEQKSNREKQKVKLYPSIGLLLWNFSSFLTILLYL